MFSFSLVTPDKKVVTNAECEEAIVPGHMGELNILPGHSPLVTTLSTGVLRYRLKGQQDFTSAAISWGYCQVSPKGIDILAETAETIEDLDVDRAEKSLKEAAEALKDKDLATDQVEQFQRKVARAQARLELAKKKK